tara:strand:- start:19 stop:552 length:534 start_codon:yes stop_codon:yes gene_type:complete
MIIVCTACEKKFSVPESAILASGRLVQCSSCGNKWTQYPIKTKKIVEKKVSEVIKKPAKKIQKKKSSPIPYSKEYMQQKWGTSFQKNIPTKNLIIKNRKKNIKDKIERKKTLKKIEKPGFGFFNYIITFGILITFLIGILKYEQYRLVRKFPFLEPYINNFFETIENFKIIIFELLK